MFLGTDEIMDMDDDEIEEVAWVTIIFIISVVLERVIHSLMEVCVLSVLHYQYIPLVDMYISVWIHSW